MTLVLIMFAVFIVLIAIGVPISFSMGLSAVSALAFDGAVPLLVLPQRFYSSLDSFSLLAIPLYIFAGEIMNLAGVTAAIVRFARSIVGHIRGGLGQVNILTSILFAGISGSAAADCAAVGSMMLPAMKREGYKPEWSVVITAASSILGPIIPPSILMVLYGSMTGLSIGTLFLAGVTPGIIMALAMMALVYIKADEIGAPRQERAPLSEVGASFLSAGPALVMPVLIIGGILSGVFTPTEAGIVAVVYGLLYGLVTRRLGAGGIYRFALGTALSSSSILIILGGAALFSWIIARAGLPVLIADWLSGVTSNAHVVLFLIVVILLVIGMFIETISALILVTPVLTPIAQAFGLDPIHFSVVTIIAVLLGSLTPPVAVLLLLTCKIGGVEYSKTMRPLAPFIFVLILGLLAIMYLPAFTLWLPRVALGYAG
ncbi:TRAP transporter large permease [Aurantimonas sp. C2-6-R+9]|uniref:TRAP transporter large permease n=1 Tax=unclassified Aurantimonas TaxID=2638230 RepID=UPI002E16FFE9|nr:MULTISPECIES: TRAP transporter large permease [unclassified Aurantimonas]MEC5293253.1 TRAP transporter large permease [Aurantimonas sp. C2-3-R2]MEC5383394.1 TRAP transporter large permease [Aurantimonas sp. C2-6-R+9]MEC5414347.1 TRAP transporter large permease [Aurantimonas sp. C2-4-R8]